MPSHTAKERLKKFIRQEEERLRRTIHINPSTLEKLERGFSPAGAVRSIKKLVKGARRIKSSPGGTIEMPERDWPFGNSGVSPKQAEVSKHDSTRHTGLTPESKQ